MSYQKAKFADRSSLSRAIAYARGDQAVPLVIRNAQWLDVFSGEFRWGDVAIADGWIVGVGESYEGLEVIDARGQYLVPGFLDSHVHIESSLMTPARFQQAVLPNGTTTAIWDPHEIANVLGVEGIRWALESTADLWLDVFVMVPSCVPSTDARLGFESSGAVLHAEHVREFAEHPRALGLAEMMNFPGLLNCDPEVMQKLLDFQHLRLDGHCPGLHGKDLNAYAVAGIHSCHESTTLEEAQEKLSKGIHVLIREGSCAKDAEALLPLLNAFTSANIGLCSDDRNPLDILDEGHIASIVEKALRAGHSAAEIFRAASYAPAQMYGLRDRGALAPGFRADICLVKTRGEGWQSGFKIESVIKSGRRVETALLAQHRSILPHQTKKNLNLPAPALQDLRLAAPPGHVRARVIEVIPSQVLTRSLSLELPSKEGQVEACLDQDVLKITVLERHHGLGYRSVGLVRGFGIHSGAIATSINHDSHNIIAVGSSDALILAAIADLMAMDGGICVRAEDGTTEHLALPIGGLMTDQPPLFVAEKLRLLKALARRIGCHLEEPFLQLSFLALPVIPSLKISDRGLIDVDNFRLVAVLEEV